MDSESHHRDAGSRRKRRLRRITAEEIEARAVACIINMGDILWNGQDYPGAIEEYGDPFEQAKKAIVDALTGLATDLR